MNVYTKNRCETCFYSEMNGMACERLEGDPINDCWKAAAWFEYLAAIINEKDGWKALAKHRREKNYNLVMEEKCKKYDRLLAIVAEHVAAYQHPYHVICPGCSQPYTCKQWGTIERCTSCGWPIRANRGPYIEAFEQKLKEAGLMPPATEEK